MKEDFLVIDHNGILRILFLKCDTLIKLKEFSDKKNINEILKENTTLNKILDNKSNNVENKIEESRNEIIESRNEIIESKKEIDTNKNIIFSPRNIENKMVTIELNDNKNKDIVIDVEENTDIIEEELNEKKVNEKCIDGCNYCVNGCDLVCTGLSYICSCVGFYISKLCRKIKKCFS
jgi:hypothetical protein